ncbi:uncharacterized protein [Amphiura filiformis]|uniref:uncharacterized protein n=1 Tax=Amphiura filiformis TaxID=82378 RepID=UPI003B225DBA
MAYHQTLANKTTGQVSKDKKDESHLAALITRDDVQNYFKAVSMLYCVYIVLQSIVSQKVRQFHDSIKKEIKHENERGGGNCNNCNPGNDPKKGKCENCKDCENCEHYIWTKKLKTYHLCPGNIHWINVDPTKFPNEPWECAKLFMGNLGKKAAYHIPNEKTLDLTALLNLMANCKADCFYGKDCSKENDVLKQRNDIHHPKTLGISREELNRCHRACNKLLNKYLRKMEKEKEEKKLGPGVLLPLESALTYMEELEKEGHISLSEAKERLCEIVQSLLDDITKKLDDNDATVEKDLQTLVAMLEGNQFIICTFYNPLFDIVIDTSKKGLALSETNELVEVLKHFNSSIYTNLYMLKKEVQFNKTEFERELQVLIEAYETYQIETDRKIVDLQSQASSTRKDLDEHKTEAGRKIGDLQTQAVIIRKDHGELKTETDRKFGDLQTQADSTQKDLDEHKTEAGRKIGDLQTQAVVIRKDHGELKTETDRKFGDLQTQADSTQKDLDEHKTEAGRKIGDLQTQAVIIRKDHQHLDDRLSYLEATVGLRVLKVR